MPKILLVLEIITILMSMLVNGRASSEATPEERAAKRSNALMLMLDAIMLHLWRVLP